MEPRQELLDEIIFKMTSNNSPSTNVNPYIPSPKPEQSLPCEVFPHLDTTNTHLELTLSNAFSVAK